MKRLGTGCSNLDRLLRGGFPLNQISLVYGEASTGKTVLCMQCAVDSAFRKLKVFYVDSDQSTVLGLEAEGMFSLRTGN